MSGHPRAIAGAILVLLASLAAGAPPVAHAAPVPVPATATVTIAARPGRAVPPSFLGLATEYNAIPAYESRPRAFDRILTLLKPADGSPLLLRVGGLSADDSLWGPALVASLPPKAAELTPASIGQIAALVRAERLHVMLDLNLAADVPDQEAQLAGLAVHDLPAGSLTGLEIGNEPDYYRFALRGNPAYYPTSYTPALYTERFLAYQAALRTTAPGVPLDGPALANPIADYRYLTDLVAGVHSGLGMLTVHRYALSACASPRSALYPTITRLLRRSASVGLADTLTRSIALARAHHVAIRWDEFNSVTCGGTLGVSDAFASALWATDTLFAALDAGVSGVNVQMRPTALNAPFYLTAAGVAPRPLLYGVLLFDRALGRGARVATARLDRDPDGTLSAWAVRVASGRLHVVLLNKGTTASTIDLRVPHARRATIERLLASSILTESRVTLAGQRIDRTGRWRGRLTVMRAPAVRGGYRIVLPPFSGTLVSLAG